MNLYNRYCIRCHGVDGRGVWDIPDVPDFTHPVWQATRPDDYRSRVILEGRGAVMPAFRGTLTLEEACAMARYLHTFLPGTEVSRPDLGTAAAAPPVGNPPGHGNPGGAHPGGGYEDPGSLQPLTARRKALSERAALHDSHLQHQFGDGGGILSMPSPSPIRRSQLAVQASPNRPSSRPGRDRHASPISPRSG